MGVEGYFQGREGDCEKRTRESFHLCLINEEEHLHYKSEAMQGLTHPLCCPGYPASCPIHLQAPSNSELGDRHWTPCLRNLPNYSPRDEDEVWKVQRSENETTR